MAFQTLANSKCSVPSFVSSAWKRSRRRFAFWEAHQIFDLSPGDYTLFKDDIAIPIEPFFGTMGVSPFGSEKPLVMPPGPFGGNLDTRHLTRGSRLFLPVQVPGALFSVGDAHAAQGDGEVCVTGIECPMYAALRFDLHKGRNLPAPQFATPGPLTPRVEGAGWYATMGVNPDLMQAAKDSLRAMVEHISTTYHMEPVESLRAREPGGGPQDQRDRGPAELDRLLLPAALDIPVAALNTDGFRRGTMP